MTPPPSPPHRPLPVVTMLRNYITLLLACHWAACTFYYSARLADFGPETWVAVAEVS